MVGITSPEAEPVKEPAAAVPGPVEVLLFPIGTPGVVEADI